jgi:site-specific DNA-methyltransferase (adenine-specific)
MNKTIKVTCDVKDYADLEDIHVIQGKLKTLSEANYKKLRDSIEKEGFAFPIHVWPNNGVYNIIGGTHRKLALTKMKEEGYDIPKIPIIKIEANDLQHAKKLLLLETSSFAKITEEGLAEFMEDMDFSILEDVELEGMEDFDFLIPPIEGDDSKDDEVPEVEENAVAKLGDVWLLGSHRLLCGDSTKREDVDKLMKGEKADMVFTDPPYGISLGFETPEQAKARNRRTDGLRVQNDDLQDDDLLQFLISSISNADSVLEKGGAFYICSPIGKEVRKFIEAIEFSNWHYQSGLVWNKSSLSLSRHDYHPKHEIIHYGWKGGKAHTWEADRKQTTVFDFDKPSKSGLHPTIKPVELVEYYISNVSKHGFKVLDLFLGSGTSIIASEKLGRSCYGMELDEKYCDVIIKRWQEYTKKEAIRESDGANFNNLYSEVLTKRSC